MRGVKAFTCRAESCGQRPYSGRLVWHPCWSQPADRSRSGQPSAPPRRNHACTHRMVWDQGKGRSTQGVCRSKKNKQVHQSSRYCCAESVSPLGLYRITWPWIFMKTEVTLHVGRKSWLNLANVQLRIRNYQANSVNTLLRSNALPVLVCLLYKDRNRKL